MKVIRNIIEIDEEACDGCGLCILGCAEGALSIVNGKAKVISDKLCDGFGTCVGACPQNALRIIQRESEPFDMKAVAEQELFRQSHKELPMEKTASTIQDNTFSELSPTLRENSKTKAKGNWPVKLRLLKSLPLNANIVLVADCAAPVTPGFYEKYVQGKVVITVCPKFEDTGPLATKLAELLRHSRPTSLTTIRMEVPCCQGIAMIAQGAANIAGLTLKPLNIVLDQQGQEISPLGQGAPLCSIQTMNMNPLA